MKKIFCVFLALAMAFSLCACSTDVRLSASYVEDGEVNEMIEQSEAIVSFNAEEGEGAVIGVDVSVPGINPVKAILTVDKNGFGFTVPGIDDNYYVAGWDVLKEATEENTGMDFSSISSFSPSDLPIGELTGIFSRYGGLLFSLIGEGTTSEESDAYKLAGLEAEVAAEVITISPTEEEWAQFFTSVFETAKGDDELKSLIEQVLAMAYNSSEDLGEHYDSAEAFAADTMEQFDDLLDQGLANTDSIAAVLSGATLQVAVGDSSIYAVKVSKDDMSLGYEGLGDFADVRRDGLFLYFGESANAVLVNTFQNTDEAFTTYATSDMITLEITATVSKTERTTLGIPVSYLNIILEDMGLYAFADDGDPDTVFEVGMVQDGGENAFRLTAKTDGSPSDITKPDTEPVEITSMEQLQEVMESIQEKFESANVAA